MGLGPLPNSPNTIKFRVSGTWNSVPWVNIFHCTYPATRPDTTQLNLLCGSFHTAFKNAFLPQMVSNVTASHTDAWDLHDATGAQGTGGTPGNGTHAGTNPCPTNVAVCVSWPVSYRWRGGHPRTYLVGMDQSEMVNGRLLVTTFRDSVVVAANTFISQVNAIATQGGNLKLVAIRYISRGAYLNPPLPLDITVSRVDQRIDSMRRRLGKPVA